MTLVLEARAKINLGLRVLGERPDGFHNISSIFQEITLSDTIHISVKPGNGRISLSCTADDIPSDSTNLVWMAASDFLLNTGELIDVDIHLQKNIPSGSGLGGGSSDAAAVLKGLRQLTARENFDLCRIAAKLGSDVPFFIRGGAASVEGRGELISAIPVIPFYVVLLHPCTKISTKWAYSKVMDANTITSLTNNTIIRHYSTSSAVWHEGKPYPHNLRNDFLPLLEKHFPEIAELAQFLRNSQCRNWGLSGSGSTLYALYKSESEARCFSETLQGTFTLCRSAETAGASSNG